MFESFQPGIFSLVAVIMFVMAATSFGYLLWMKGRTRSSQMMLWFFLCVILSSLATLLTNLGTPWSWAFAPSQDAFLMLGGIFLVRFAYLYPQQERSRQARWATWIATAVAVFALGYSIWFGLRYLASLPIEIGENDLYYVLTPLVMLGVIGVFFRRSVKVSRNVEASNDAGNISGLQLLLRPTSTPASALRNLGLALSLGLIPAITLMIKFSLPTLISSFIFNFGVVAAISAIMLVYLNYSQELTTITVKLVGISLVTVLLLLGFTCVSLLTLIPALETSRIVTIFIAIVLGGSVLVLTVFPAFFKVTLFEPLSELLEAVKAVDQGDLDQQLQSRFPDEVGEITSSFNRMTRSLSELTEKQKNRAAELEQEVLRRTKEIQDVNLQLLEENEQREKATIRLDKQLRYEQALARCSQILLSTQASYGNREQKLTKALEVLRAGADADRAYVIQRYEDSDGVELLKLSAESCAPGIKDLISNPVNQHVQVSVMPERLIGRLSDGLPVSGPIKDLYAGHELKDYYLNQDPPLLSLLLFPIKQEDRWWGIVGFDDCETARDWEQSEVIFLQTASEMIGSTVHRWEIQDQLGETFQDLERKVDERTASLNVANQQLQAEIAARRLVQENLERRLKTKRLLASASANLAEAKHISSAFENVLGDLGELMQAEAVTLVVDNHVTPKSFRYTYNWHRPSSISPDPALINILFDPDAGLFSKLNPDPFVIVDPKRDWPEAEDFDAEFPGEIIIWPLASDGSLLGLLVITGSELDGDVKIDTLQTMEVFVGLLGGMLERDNILRNLEARVTEQTRELATMYEMAMLTGSSTDLSEILHPALSRIQEITGSEAAAIHLYSEEDEALVLSAQKGIPGDVIPDLERIPIGSPFKEWLENPDPDHTRTKALPSGVPDKFCLRGFESMMMSKLRAADTTQGVISCFRITDEPYTAFQTSMLAVIGELLGVVIENRRLTRESEKLATVHERQRLARELHDAVTQSVYSLSLFARSARDAYEEHEQGKLEDALEEIELNSIAALREMRLLLYQLRSLALEEADLHQAVDARFDMVERRLGINATLEIEPGLALEDSIEQEFFRIITEALNNSLHHANAEEVTVSLTEHGKMLRLTIEDDGSGFNPVEVREGMGLQNMRDRLQVFDGELRIISHPGGGTHLEINLPLDQPEGVRP